MQPGVPSNEAFSSAQSGFGDHKVRRKTCFTVIKPVKNKSVLSVYSSFKMHYEHLQTNFLSERELYVKQVSVTNLSGLQMLCSLDS